MALIVSRLPGVDKLKLIKLLYLADRSHFLQYGYPITGDSQVAMRYGPVPSLSLDTLNGDGLSRAKVTPFLGINEQHVVFLNRDPGTNRLSAQEIETLITVVKQHGQKTTSKLLRELHQSPEYKEVYVPGTSTPIPYDVILKHFGSSSQFHHNRPVVDSNMASHMLCPFRGSGADL